MDLIKKTWDDITITDWKNIVAIEQRELDSTLEKDIAVLAVLCGVPEKDLYAININELNELLLKADWIKKEQFTFNHKFNTKKIKIAGKTYTVNPDLDKFSVAQYMDFQNFWNKDRDKHIGNLLAVFIVPEGCNYNEGYDVIELAQTLEDSISLRFYNEVCFFFLQNWLNSIKASIIYSTYMTKKMVRKTRNKEVKKMLKEKEKELTEQMKQILLIG